MTTRNRITNIVATAAVLANLAAPVGMYQPVRALGEEPWSFILPEQRRMRIRRPDQLPVARLARIPAPSTVSRKQPGLEAFYLSLDEALHIALANAKVIRVLSGSTGRTIYDPAVTNTGIDAARGVFDPTLQLRNSFNRRHTPSAGFVDPMNPASGVRFGGTPIHDYEMSMGLSKQSGSGGTAALGVNTNPLHAHSSGLPLNPQAGSSVDMSYTQPLLRGAGYRVNTAPIVIARLDTERSYFQLKGSVQQLVRGVIDGYWALVSARTDLWARQQQVQQSEWFDRRTEAQFRVGGANLGDRAQATAALANFRASLISSKANVLSREAALRSILRLPPSDNREIIPVTPPFREKLNVDWQEVLRLAEANRPDLIELKLILEADEQRLLTADNQALPQLDASALYRWNGLEGRTPDRQFVRTDPGDFTGWQLGVTFSVPLGLRQSRASLRQRELVVMRDRANLHQGLHDATHTLAASYRNLDQFYDQYGAFKQARTASFEDLNQQTAEVRVGSALFLDFLNALTSWGNAVSSEAQSLTQYNTELANLELQTGTILDAHGIRFYEERFASIGPLGRLGAPECYPRDIRLGPNDERYGGGTEPAERSFNLNAPTPPSATPNLRPPVPRQ